MPSSPETSPESQSGVSRLKKKEDEHLRLMRQMRTIQADRSNAVEGVNPLFRREDELLCTLNNEYQNLRKDLRIATAGAHKKKDKRIKRDLKKSILGLQHTEFKQEAGLTVISQLDGLLQRNNKQMLALRSLAVARLDKIAERKCNSEQRLMSAENKLETAMLRFNVVQHENQKIREQIEHMLRDRALFNQRWSRILSILKTGKKFLCELFESSTLAYDQRDEWVAKLRSMQEKGMMDQLMQVQEMQSLQKAYDHDMKLYNFLSAKGVTRINPTAEKKELEKKKKKEDEMRNELENYCRILDEIQSYTDELDVGKIKETFKKIEQENFSVYERLTSYCAENVVLDKMVKDIRRDIADRRDYNEFEEAKRQRKLESYRKQLTDVVTRNTKLREKLDKETKDVTKAMQKIAELFKMLGCSLEPFMNLLGDKEPTLRRQNLALQLITEKINEYIEVVYFCERRTTAKPLGRSPDRSRLKKYFIHPETARVCTATKMATKLPTDPCPACMESWWMFRITETQEKVFSKKEVMAAIENMKCDPLFDTSERIHAITDCKSPQSRLILSKRYMN